MKEKQQTLLKQLPAIQRLLSSEPIKQLLSLYPRLMVVESLRQELRFWRDKIISDHVQECPSLALLIDETSVRLKKKFSRNLCRVVNGTGIVLHTNLGRAVFSSRVIESIVDVAGGYSNLEMDLQSGKRGFRHQHARDLLLALTGAEEALVVNNNAAAILLMLNTLAKDREVIVSRGELVEIGGSFRIPEVMKLSGARLIEVGTTNKTHLRDYANAITSDTVAILRVHPSNYRIFGFTEQVSTKELVRLALEKGLVVLEDLGSGSLVDLSSLDLPYEPSVQEVIEQGVDVVAFSGDKLLGGPQAGIILGRRRLLSKMLKNNLLRALRIDKLTMAALEAVLKEYLNPEKVKESIPTLKMLTFSDKQLKARAKSLASKLKEQVGEQVDVQVCSQEGEVGGGSLPLTSLRSWAVQMKSKTLSAQEMARHFRKGDPPIIGLIHREAFVIDLRTVQKGEGEDILMVLKEFLGRAIP